MLRPAGEPCASSSAGLTAKELIGRQRGTVAFSASSSSEKDGRGCRLMELVQGVIRQEYERGLKMEENEEDGDGDDYWTVGDEGEGEGDGEFE